MLGYSHAELVGLAFERLLNGDGGAVGDNAQVRLLEEPTSRVEWSFRRKDGSTFVGELAVVAPPNGRIQGIVRDITERREREAERLKLESELARTDPLTGLRNRRGFEEQGDQHFNVATRHALSVVLALLDLDGFKEVNDTLGHSEGDRVLCEVAGVLSSLVRSSDVVARIGGDEFGFVLLGVDENGARSFFGRLMQELDDRMEKENWPVSFSIGVTIYTGRPPTREVAIDEADELLYSAKRGAGSHVVLRECSSPTEGVESLRSKT